jgi:hypothetical protein
VEEDANFCLIKDVTIFPLCCVTNPALENKNAIAQTGDEVILIKDWCIVTLKLYFFRYQK